jgi:predicted nucleotidyltransferase
VSGSNGFHAERTIVSAIQAAIGPDYPILLLGSRARNEAAPESDYDVYVVLPAVKSATAVRRVGKVSRRLGQELGVGVSINPLPRFRIKRPGSTLLVWKLGREGKVLAAPNGFRLDEASPPAPSSGALSSYAISGLRFLVEDLDPRQLAGSPLDHRLQRQMRKAALHAAQIALLKRGLYATRLPDALDLLDGEERERLWLAGEGELEPDLWFTLRTELLSNVEIPRPGLVRTTLESSQYTVLSMLRGRGYRSPFDVLGPCERLWQSLTLLANAVRPGGEVDGLDVEAAARALPPRLRRQSGSWGRVRDLVVSEWPSADPLVGV